MNFAKYPTTHVHNVQILHLRPYIGTKRQAQAGKRARKTDCSLQNEHGQRLSHRRAPQAQAQATDADCTNVYRHTRMHSPPPLPTPLHSECTRTHTCMHAYTHMCMQTDGTLAFDGVTPSECRRYLGFPSSWLALMPKMSCLQCHRGLASVSQALLIHRCITPQAQHTLNPQVQHTTGAAHLESTGASHCRHTFNSQAQHTFDLNAFIHRHDTPSTRLRRHTFNLQ